MPAEKLLGGVLPFWSQAAVVILLGTGMAGNATAEFKGAGEFEVGVQGFEEAGLADAVGSFLIFNLKTREGLQVTPHEQAWRIYEGF